MPIVDALYISSRFSFRANDLISSRLVRFSLYLHRAVSIGSRPAELLLV